MMDSCSNNDVLCDKQVRTTAAQERLTLTSLLKQERALKAKHVNFRFKMMSFVFKMMSFVFKMMSFVFKMMSFVFKMMVITIYQAAASDEEKASLMADMGVLGAFLY